jgi:hypothetical protein
MLGKEEKLQDQHEMIPFQVKVDYKEGMACAAEPFLDETTQVEMDLSDNDPLDTCPEVKKYICRWNNSEIQFDDFKDFVVHCNRQVTDLQFDEPKQCQWKNCWNQHSFTSVERLIEHLRAHTLEKPYMVRTNNSFLCEYDADCIVPRKIV